MHGMTQLLHGSVQASGQVVTEDRMEEGVRKRVAAILAYLQAAKVALVLPVLQHLNSAAPWPTSSPSTKTLPCLPLSVPSVPPLSC